MSEIKFNTPDWLKKLNQLTYLSFSVASRKSGGKTYFTLSYAAQNSGLFPKFIELGGTNLNTLKNLVEQAIKGFGEECGRQNKQIDPFIGSENVLARLYALRNLSENFPPTLGESAVTKIEREKFLQYLKNK